MQDSYSFIDNSLSFDDYNAYISKWMEGISSEINYWTDFVHRKIDEKKILIKNNSSKKIAILNYQDRSYLEEEYSCVQENSSVLDIGCGAVPMYANLLKEKNVSFYSVDLLANIYRNIYSNLKLDIRNLPNLGLVENLSSLFSNNSFDFVHASNSLDHSFDPILGLWQMLYVSKIGAKIILRHNSNEAERENYLGLHQWNICVENGKLTIWRNNKKFDVEKMLEGYASIEKIFLTKLSPQSNIDVNFVIIKKIDNSPLYLNPYINQLTISLLSEYSHNIYDKMFHEKEILYSLLKDGFSYDNVYIYGAGEYGKCVYRVLNNIGVKVKCVFDKNVKTFCDSIKVLPYSPENLNSNDCIIIASQAYKDEIESILLKDSEKIKFKCIKISE